MPFHESNDDLLATQVGSCPQCETLFTLPVASEPFDMIRCPGCGGQFSLGAIKMRGLRLAEAVIASPEAPAIDLGEKQDQVIAPTESMKEPMSEATKGSTSSPEQESLEEWLKRTTGVSLAQSEEQNAEAGKLSSEEVPAREELIEKELPAQNQTVDWTPGSFSLETPEETNSAADTTFQMEEPKPATESEATQESSSSIESLLQQAEQQLADSEMELARVKSEEASEPTSFKLPDFEMSNKAALVEDQSTSEFPTREEERQEELQNVIEDHFDASDIANRLETVHQDEHPRNRWGGPVSALAGLLVIGGVSYVIFSNQLGLDEDLVADHTNRAPALDEDMEEVDSIIPVAGIESEEEQALEPATFNEPITGSTPIDDSVGERYSQPQESLTDPNVFTPSAEPVAISPQADIVPFNNTQPKNLPVHRLQGAPTYGVDELKQASDYSESLVKQIQEAALSEDENRDQFLGKHYAELCYLAQVISLLDLNSTSDDLKTTEMLAVDHYKRLFQNQAAATQVNQVAQHWIEWAERPYGGVFLMGVPDDMQYAGELFTYRVPLGDSFVHIVTEEPINVDRFVMTDSQTMGIIGIVVENPKDRIRGYEGDADRVIWCRKTIPIGDVQPWTR